MTLIRRCTAGAVIALASGCDIRGTSPTLEPEIGTGLVYGMITFNGRTIPAQVTDGQSNVLIRKGALTLAADSTWIVSYVIRVSGGGTEQNSIQTTRGTYSLVGTTLNLRFTNDTTLRLRGTYSPTDVALTDVTVANGDQLVFRKS